MYLSVVGQENHFHNIQNPRHSANIYVWSRLHYLNRFTIVTCFTNKQQKEAAFFHNYFCQLVVPAAAQHTHNLIDFWQVELSKAENELSFSILLKQNAKLSNNLQFIYLRLKNLHFTVRPNITNRKTLC